MTRPRITRGVSPESVASSIDSRLAPVAASVTALTSRVTALEDGFTPAPSGAVSVAGVPLASEAYSAHAIAGAVTLPSNGTRAITLTGDATLTLAGANGATVALDVTTSGSTLTIVNGPTITTGGLYGLVRSAGEWKGGTSGGTTPSQTEPTRPRSFMASSTQTTITATWEPSLYAPGIVGYDAKIDSGAWTDIHNVTTYTWTGLTGPKTYTVSVRARGADGTTSQPATATVSTGAAAKIGAIIEQDAPTFFMRFDDPAGTTAPAIKVGSGATSIAGGVTFGNPSVDGDGTCAFVPAGGYIDLPRDQVLGAGDFTVEMIFAGTLDDDPYKETWLYAQNGTFSASVQAITFKATDDFGVASVAVNMANYPPAPSGLTHFLVTHQAASTTTRLYVNGVERAVTSDKAWAGKASNAGQVASIGRPHTYRSGTRPFHMAKLAIYRGKVLTPTRIAAHVNALGLS